MKKTLKYIKVDNDQCISIMCDSTSAINVSKNHVMHSKTKQILIKYHSLMENVAEKIVKMEYIATKEKIEYIFTKPLPKDTFVYLRKKCRVRAISSQNLVLQGKHKFKESSKEDDV